MQILMRLGSLLSPSFFAILAGLTLIAAALCFVVSKRSPERPQGTKLSDLEPTEYRSTGYLIFAFSWSMIGLVLGFILGVIGTGFLGNLVLVILSLLCLLFTLCFLYAGGGTLLHAVTGQNGGVVYWFFPFMRSVDTLIVRFGDLLAEGIFRLPRRPRIVTEIGSLAETLEETPTTVIPGYKKAKADRDMDNLRQKLAEYEAGLTLRQKASFVEMKRVMEELRSLYT